MKLVWKPILKNYKSWIHNIPPGHASPQVVNQLFWKCSVDVETMVDRLFTAIRNLGR